VKRCTKCGETKPLAAFSRCSTAPDHKQWWCKKCISTFRKAWSVDNRAKEGTTSYRYNRRWRRANPVGVAALNLRRRAQKTGCEGSATAAELETLPDFCVFCFATKDLTDAHIVPLKRGGTGWIENLTKACRSCNSSQGYKLVEEWL